MKLLLDTTKTLEENAAFYFEKSKKAKKKLEGIEIILENSKKKLQSETEQQEKEQRVYDPLPVKKWYMKFRWFISSDGFLCIGEKMQQRMK